MKLAGRPELDLLCGEYVLGTLQGPARRRFERQLRQEPLVALRLRAWEQTMSMPYPDHFTLQPQAATWQRIRRSLELDRYAPPWHQRLALWRAWAALATALLLAVVLWPRLGPTPVVPFAPVAVLEGKAPASRITVALSADRRRLRIASAQPMLSAPSQSFELWLIADAQSAPLPVAVLGSLQADFELPAALQARIGPGAQFAVSVEPAGGSPQAGPTGPVIASGAVRG